MGKHTLLWKKRGLLMFSKQDKTRVSLLYIFLVHLVFLLVGSQNGRHTQTSLSWAMSCVFTCPETRFTRPNTWPVSSPQIVQVVSMLDVPAGSTNMLKNTNTNDRATQSNCSLLTIYYKVDFSPSRLGSTSFQSKDVRGAQKSEFLLLFSKHSRRVSVSLTCVINAKKCHSEWANFS